MRWRGGYKDRGRGYEEGEGKICGVEKRYDRVGGGQDVAERWSEAHCVMVGASKGRGGKGRMRRL